MLSFCLRSEGLADLSVFLSQLREAENERDLAVEALAELKRKHEVRFYSMFPCVR